MATRIDILLTEKGHTRSRSEAQDLIKRGKVTVNGITPDKPSREFPNDVSIVISETQYVGRGAHKLEHALSKFNVNPKDKICLDVGASTGGFTEVLLKHGAKKVVAVDTGTNQLAESLQSDSRVYSIEHTDIRNMSDEQLTESILQDQEYIQLVVVDVSFISLTHILSPIRTLISNRLIKTGRTHDARPIDIICLIKPQFEIGKEYIGKNGVVQIERPDIQQVVTGMIHSLIGHALSLGYKQADDCIESPIKGGSGNTEYLVHLTYHTEDV